MSKRGFWGKAYIVLCFEKYTSMFPPPPGILAGSFHWKSPVFVFRESAGRGGFLGCWDEGFEDC